MLIFEESDHPVFRATTPLSRGHLKSKGHGKLSIHFAADEHTIDTIFRIILSVNQLSVYGAVADLCEEFEAHQDRSGEPDMLMGQTIVLGDLKAEIPLQNDNSMNEQVLWQQYIDQIESLSPENKLSRFCKEAGFTRIVEVGQYFVTMNPDEYHVHTRYNFSCREYTLPRSEPNTEPKGWIQDNKRIGPVMEVTTTFQHYKYGIEIRIPSVKNDNSHSWVRISFGTVKYVKEDNTEIPEVPQDAHLSETGIKVVAARSKAKAKPQPKPFVGTTVTIPMQERRWSDIEPSKQDLFSHDLSKEIVRLLRHNQTLQREHDGAILFYKIKFLLRDRYPEVLHWSDDRWISCLAKGGGPKRRYQYCALNSAEGSRAIIYLRAIQGHSDKHSSILHYKIMY